MTPSEKRRPADQAPDEATEKIQPTAEQEYGITAAEVARLIEVDEARHGWLGRQGLLHRPCGLSRGWLPWGVLLRLDEYDDPRLTGVERRRRFR